MNKLALEIESLLNAEAGHYSVVVQCDGETLVSIEPDRSYHAASLIKVPILLSVLTMWQNEEIDLEERIVLTEAEKVMGSGILYLMESGASYNLLELLKLMICISDNTATNILIERFGIECVNSLMNSLDIHNTHLARKLMIQGTGTFSKTTAGDMVELFSHFTKDGHLNPVALQLGQKIFSQQQINNRINRDWKLCGNCGSLMESQNICIHCGKTTSEFDPYEVPFLHKTGEINGVVHDAGILEHNGKQIIIAVMSDGLPSNLSGESVLSRIGNLIYQEAIKEA
jgi:beta-lactamase class A